MHSTTATPPATSVTTPTATSGAAPADESALPHRRVRADLVGGIAVLAVVIGGNLVWNASDAGIVAAFGGR